MFFIVFINKILHIFYNKINNMFEVYELKNILNKISIKKNEKFKKKLKEQNIFTDINKNIEYIKKVYESEINTGIIFREFDINYNNKLYKGCIVFIESLSDTEGINNFILKPLMINDIFIQNKLDEAILGTLLLQFDIKNENSFSSIIDKINSGFSVLFVDTLDSVFVIETKKYEHRGIESPKNEISLKGSQESFVESIKSNVSILRRLINNENLVLEQIVVGKRSKTTCMIGYISNIANPKIVNEVRRRMQNISVDFLLDSGQLEHLIEDHPFLTEPQILSTERPDKVASHLTEGRVCIIVNNTPYVLVVPFTFWDFFHSADDYNLKFQYANLLRLVRIIAYVCSLFLPALYIAITNYHVDLLPTDLLFSIAAIKEGIPFPLIVEILIMEISFELIREASARMPGSVGSSLGIVGAVLVGQATVDANLVSPILILVISLTGISSFATPNYSLGLSFRILRFAYIFLASISGLLGIALGIVIHLIILCGSYTFNIPYFASFGEYQKKPFRDGIVLFPSWLNSFRPPFLKTLDNTKSEHISRKWI